jgi:hypothetical protein
MLEYSHLRIEDAAVLLNNGYSLIVCLDGVEGILVITDDGRNVQSQVLGMHLRREGVGNTLLFTRPNFHPIAYCRQVSNKARSRWIEIGGPEAPTSEVDCDRPGFVVAEGQDSLGWLSIDQLDTEDLGGGEVDIDRDR